MKKLSFILCVIFVINIFNIGVFASDTPNLSSDGYYELANYSDLLWFADYVNNDNDRANARLVNDIVANENLLNSDGELNYIPDSSWTIIGKDWYNGKFDGNGYSISGLYFDDSSVERVGLIGRSSDSAVIKNLSILDSYFYGKFYVGSLAGRGYGTISNIYSNSTVGGRMYIGGIDGRLDDTTKIANCLYYGKIKDGSINYTNPIVSEYYDASADRISNCYYNTDSKYSSKYATSVTSEQLASGEVCYLLNGDQSDIVWTQNIDKGNIDTNPYPSNRHLRVLKKDGVYTNADCTNHIYVDGKCSICGYECVHKYVDSVCSICGYECKHSNFVDDVCSDCGYVCTHANYENGLCTICKKQEIPELVDNYYNIKNYGNLLWFANYVNSGNTSSNAKLVDNIVANDNLIDDSGKLNGTPTYNWTPIASDDNSYSGIFDGAGHSISGLYVIESDSDYIGLISCMAQNSVVKNLSIVDSYIDGYYYVGSVVGKNYGKIENVYSNAIINCSMYGGGIAGIMSVGSSITNCLYNGKIISTDTDCTNAIVSEKYYVKNDSIVNCYYNTDCKFASSYASGVTSSQIVSGEICYLLNGDQSNISWTQNIDKSDIDQYPYPNTNHYKVYKNDDTYNNYIVGDVNSDEIVDKIDVALILKYVTGKIDNIDIDSADVNKDGNINILDSCKLLEKIA